MSLPIVLFDDTTRNNLLPLAYTKPVALLRVGITTIKEKWENFAPVAGYSTIDYLSIKYNQTVPGDVVFVNGAVIPSEELFLQIQNLKEGQTLVKDKTIIASMLPGFKREITIDQISNPEVFSGEIDVVENVWDIFRLNGKIIISDFAYLTKGRKSQPIPTTVNVLSTQNIFIEEGAELNFVTINANDGPVYIGKNSKILEGSVIKGPMALCEESVIKMGAKIYGKTTIGPHCKVGGEVMNAVLQAYSNKGHDGYLGNSVLGEWCNLGADTNTSNLKNNYAKVKLWNYDQERFVNTGLQFCGLIIGDHSKCGINTMFNTGTMVGVSANIYGGGFPRNFIPSYAWGGSGGFMLYKFEKALETARIVMDRRGIQPDDAEVEILNQIYQQTEKYRRF